jgi:heme/copper-type cytochrome/quinol oxidase subunit 4|nr:MAG TPA: hypothetical protein [Caudoviricetes sp.]
MPDNNNSSKDNFMYYLFQLVVWVIMLILILLRVFTYKTISNNWIWIINYAGMSIAFINILVNKCFNLKEKKSKKYKPFVGFTVVLVVITCILVIPVYLLQNNQYSQSLNDIITLLALFFSLSNDIWNRILNFFANIIK